MGGSRGRTSAAFSSKRTPQRRPKIRTRTTPRTARRARRGEEDDQTHRKYVNFTGIPTVFLFTQKDRFQLPEVEQM